MNCYICGKKFKSDRGTMVRLYPDGYFRKIHIKCGGSKVEIILIKDGPIIVEDKGKKIALCRCGLSDNKPLCDGNHRNCLEELPEGIVRDGEFIEAKGGG